jgi:hypothetical protein
MQIVIDIPEEEYKCVMDGKWEGNALADYIENGTPLPKGHGNLIDVNRKVTVSTYDEQYEEWGAETLTVLEVLNKWSDEGVTAKDVIIQADKESEEV